MTHELRTVEPLETWPLGLELHGHPPGVLPLTPTALAHLRATLAQLDLLDADLTPDPADPARRSPKPWLLPAFKLEPDQGWLVTPDECTLLEEAVQRLTLNDHRVPEHLYWELGIPDDAPAQEALEDLLDALPTFAAVANEHGGFRVVSSSA